MTNITLENILNFLFEVQSWSAHINSYFTVCLTLFFYGLISIIQSHEYRLQFKSKAALIWNHKTLHLEWSTYFNLSDQHIKFLLNPKTLIHLNTYRILVSSLFILLAFINFNFLNLFSQSYFSSYHLSSISSSIILSTLLAALLLSSFLIHLFMCVVFRGTTNGGSDMISLVVATGLTQYFVLPQNHQNLGLVYIAIHTFWSYFKAGWVKLIDKDWRSGYALQVFFQRKILKQTLFKLNLAHKITYFILCWSVIFFELSFLILFFKPEMSIWYGIAALIFHFINFIYFGLNRFFWAWLSAWPALVWAINLIHS